MANIRKAALTQTITSLQSVAAIKLVTDRPKAIEYADEFPFAFVSVGEDLRVDYVGVPGNDKELEGQITVDFYAKLDNETLIKDFLDVIQAAEDKIDADVATFRGLTPPVYLDTPLRIVDGPFIDIDRELVFANCSFSYHDN